MVNPPPPLRQTWQRFLDVKLPMLLEPLGDQFGNQNDAEIQLDDTRPRWVVGEGCGGVVPGKFFRDFEKAGQRSLILPFGGNKHGFCVGWVDPKQDKTS